MRLKKAEQSNLEVTSRFVEFILDIHPAAWERVPSAPGHRGFSTIVNGNRITLTTWRFESMNMVDACVESGKEKITINLPEWEKVGDYINEIIDALNGSKCALKLEKVNNFLKRKVFLETN